MIWRKGYEDRMDLHLEWIYIEVPAQRAVGAQCVQVGHPARQKSLQGRASVGFDEELAALAAGQARQAHRHYVEHPYAVRREFEREPYAVDLPAWTVALLRREPTAARRLAAARKAGSPPPAG